LAEKEFTVEELRRDYEAQKFQQSATQEKQKVLSRDFSSSKDKVYQLSKDQEIKQIQLSTLKQELEKTASDDNNQEASLLDFEDKLVTLQR
jgi:chromosome segregation protein